MGYTKKIDFLDSINETADIFKALGHPARLQILKILMKEESCTCGSIVEELPLAQSTVSKHLMELKKVKLISVKIEGKKTIYSLNNENFTNPSLFLSNHLTLNQESTKENLTKKQLGSTLDQTYKNLKNKRRNRKSNPNLKNFNHIFSHKKTEQ